MAKRALRPGEGSGLTRTHRGAPPPSLQREHREKARRSGTVTPKAPQYVVGGKAVSKEVFERSVAEQTKARAVTSTPSAPRQTEAQRIEEFARRRAVQLTSGAKPEAVAAMTATEKKQFLAGTNYTSALVGSKGTVALKTREESDVTLVSLGRTRREERKRRERREEQPPSSIFDRIREKLPEERKLLTQPFIDLYFGTKRYIKETTPEFPTYPSYLKEGKLPLTSAGRGLFGREDLPLTPLGKQSVDRLFGITKSTYTTLRERPETIPIAYGVGFGIGAAGGLAAGAGKAAEVAYLGGVGTLTYLYGKEKVEEFKKAPTFVGEGEVIGSTIPELVGAGKGSKKGLKYSQKLQIQLGKIKQRLGLGEQVKTEVPSAKLIKETEPFTRQRPTLIVKTAEGKYVFGKTKSGEIISFGGKGKKGETTKEAALREFKEETGLGKESLKGVKYKTKQVFPEETFHVYEATLKKGAKLKAGSDIVEIVELKPSQIPKSTGQTPIDPYGQKKIRGYELGIINFLQTGQKPTWLYTTTKQGQKIYIGASSRYDVPYSVQKRYIQRRGKQLFISGTQDPAVLKKYSFPFQKKFKVDPKKSRRGTEEGLFLQPPVSAKRDAPGYLGLRYTGIGLGGKRSYEGFKIRFGGQKPTAFAFLEKAEYPIKPTAKTRRGIESELLIRPDVQIKTAGKYRDVLIGGEKLKIQPTKIVRDSKLSKLWKELGEEKTKAGKERALKRIERESGLEYKQYKVISPSEFVPKVPPSSRFGISRTGRERAPSRISGVSLGGVSGVKSRVGTVGELSRFSPIKEERGRGIRERERGVSLTRRPSGISETSLFETGKRKAVTGFGAPLIFPIKGKKPEKRLKKIKRRKFEYRPSLTAIEAPRVKKLPKIKTFGGLEERPILAR